jgi:PP-loop superfamily ATP-utilizing enzyme
VQQNDENYYELTNPLFCNLPNNPYLCPKRKTEMILKQAKQNGIDIIIAIAIILGLLVPSMFL